MKLITSVKNPIVQHLLRLQKESDYRKQKQTLIIESQKIIREAFKRGAIVQSYAQEGHDSQASETIFLKKELVKKISQLKSPDGLFAEVPRPSNACLMQCSSILVLDHLQDPGNLGTLLRSAKAFGFEGAFLLNTCDPFSPKVLRASMGASLTLPIRVGDHDDLEKTLENFEVLVADAHGKDAKEMQPAKPCALVLSNESKGASSYFETHSRVSIPIQSIDSLNVAIAGSLLMYTLQGGLDAR